MSAEISPTTHAKAHKARDLQIDSALLSLAPRVIPHLNGDVAPSPHASQYLEALERSGFQGEVSRDLARRLVGATDNSVYQLLPEAIVYPRDTADVSRALTLLGEPEHARARIAPRGGGTGTNGQSLTIDLSLDLSRHLNQVLEVNLDEGWTRVEAGVVLDQLNDQLRDHQVFFAPNLSPSSRATLGGMINTDAAGKGSRIYGKTSDHVLELDVTLVGGEAVTLRALSGAEVRDRARDPQSFEARVALPLLELARREHDTIEEVFPDLSRFMTGYNLRLLYDAETDILDLTRLVSGSEGTLGVVTAAKLKLTPLPRARQLILFRYSSFSDALGSAQLLLDQAPSAIETIDEHILTLARADASYLELREVLEDDLESNQEDKQETKETRAHAVRAINLVEFEGVSADDVAARVARCIAQVEPLYGAPNTPIGHRVAESARDQSLLWSLRKRGVGLLAARPGARKPIAFIEDTVVPPERLSAYIKDMTAILDEEGVEYGMFGHVDVGCLHVRPALNLRDPEDEARFKRISDRVATLVRSYGGLIWGEHGKGIRSAYSPDFFGPLYPTLQEVKAIFDPLNQLNPGKVATPAGSHEALLELMSPLRAHHDRLIGEDALAGFEVTVSCNGNGQCFDYHPDHLMCPSARVTRDRLHSPKGRAGVMRAWLSALSARGYDLKSHEFDPRLVPVKRGWARCVELIRTPQRALVKRWRARRLKSDLSAQVHEAMSGCLSCKACATACPVRVDVPQFKSRFLRLFYQRYPRPLRDYLVSALERLAAWGTHVAPLLNALLTLPPTRWVNRHLIGLVDPPALSQRSALKRLSAVGFLSATPARLNALSDQERARAVVVIPDAFNTFFDADTLVDAHQVLRRLGFLVFTAPFSPNGKGAHVKGRIEAFKRDAQAHLNTLRPLAETGTPLICVEPAVALTYRDEYRETFDSEYWIDVELVQEWLGRALDYTDPNRLKELTTSLKSLRSNSHAHLELFGHCTERSLAPSALRDWERIFTSLGVEIESREVGCCGMCGVYGHEQEHEQNSRALFDMSWAPALREVERVHHTALATGYSCRAQVKRCAPELNKVIHPLSYLERALGAVDQT